METYIAHSPVRNQYKIGRSGDPKKRVSQMRTYCPDLLLVATIEGDLEVALHETFSHLRVKRVTGYSSEWFDSGDDLLFFITQHAVKKKDIVYRPISPVPVRSHFTNNFIEGKREIPSPEKGNRNGHYHV